MPSPRRGKDTLRSGEDIQLDAFFRAAQAMVKRSPDPSTKVGAVVVGPDGVVRGAGWNQFPLRAPQNWWGSRVLKYRLVVHAEVAAIMSAGAADGCTLYVTHHPCPECAKLIAYAGIREVVCPPGPWRDDPEVRALCAEAREVLDVCGVNLREVPKDEVV